MNCKNCASVLSAEDQFCNGCGAKVIVERITLKRLVTEVVSNVFGFDTKYFRTLKMMILNPKEVLEDYLSGVRKKYVNPFAFLAIGAALSLLIFNFFADDFIRIQGAMNAAQIEEMKELANQDLSLVKDLPEKEFQQLKVKQDMAKLQVGFLDNWLRFLLKYLNLMTFVFLFFYAAMSKLTYWKPYNFGEHIVINAFIQGTTMWLTIIIFFISLLINPNIYSFSFYLIIFYYLYVFKKLSKHSLKRSVGKLFRFLIIFSLLFFIIIVIGIVIGAAYMIIKKGM